jgi:hypothetical protein
LVALGDVNAERLFAINGLSGSGGGKHILQMVARRRANNYCIHVWAGTERLVILYAFGI